jgi:hypothetical protein
MIRLLTGCLLAGWLISGPAAAEEPIERLARNNGWMTQYDSARAAARQTGKPMFVVFRCQP